MKILSSVFMVMATGFDFPEGPVWGPDGRLYLSSCRTPAVCRLERRQEWRIYERIGCNGLAFDSQGRLIICDPNQKRLARLDEPGRAVTLVAAFQGKPLHGPNDLVLDRDDNIYFTDPAGWDRRRQPKGGIYRLTPAGEISLLADDIPTPNGIVLRPDGVRLLVASTHGQCIWQFTLDDRGQVRSRRVFARLDELAGGPDGMALDERGNLYVAMFGAGCVVVIDPAGRPVGRLPTGGKRPTNCCFGGRDFRTLYVTETEHNRVIAYRLDVAGQRPLNLPGPATSRPVRSTRHAATSAPQ